MMLNIASEPMAVPITKPRRAKKPRSTSGASMRDSTLSSRTSAIAASANGTITGSGAVCTCGSACSANTSDTMKVASRAKPIQSARRLCLLCGVRGRRARGHHAGDGDRHEQHVEPEDRAPADEVRERAAEQRPDAEAEHQEAGPGADRGGPALGRRAGVDGCERARHRECRCETLQGTAGQEFGLCLRERDDAGGEAEQHQPGDRRRAVLRSGRQPGRRARCRRRRPPDRR